MDSIGSPRRMYDPGTFFDERFVIQRRLGRGGFAQVYLATQHDLGREIALKILDEPDDVPPEAAAEGRKRFTYEAKALSRLSSHHIATLFECNLEHDPPYLILDYIEGDTLQDELRERPTRPWAHVRDDMAQLLDGLVEAHHHGLLHRDLKPSNIMVSQDIMGERRLVLLDFGIVKSLRDQSWDQTTAHRMLGTPRYMAPEYILGVKDSANMDLYSLGLIAAEMLLGHPVLSSNDPVQLIGAHLAGELDIPWERLEPQAAAWLRRALERDPEERFAHPRAALDALHATTLELTGLADTEPAPQRRAPIALVALILTLCAVGAVALAANQGQETVTLEANEPKAAVVEEVTERPDDARTEEPEHSPEPDTPKEPQASEEAPGETAQGSKKGSQRITKTRSKRPSNGSSRKGSGRKGSGKKKTKKKRGREISAQDGFEALSVESKP